MMNRRRFVQSGALAALSARANSVERASSPLRPNVLVLLPDQWRAQSLGCYGNSEVHTPHLDKLASEGSLLTNVIANSPVCCPARAVMLTGTYASTNGLVANDLRLRQGLPSVASAFASVGYRTGFIGKWHLDGGPRNLGFVPPGPRRHGFQFWAANEAAISLTAILIFTTRPSPWYRINMSRKSGRTRQLDSLIGIAMNRSSFSYPLELHMIPTLLGSDTRTCTIRRTSRCGVTGLQSKEDRVKT
jgi:hypothetical protein